MGSCVSSVRKSHRGVGSSDCATATAWVISVNGELREYPIPCTVSQVLLLEELEQQKQKQNSSSSASVPASCCCVLCNSDSLYYDEKIPAMEDGAHLIPNQIYFVIPKTKLQKPLSASDMAAMAVKASLALENKNDGGDRRRRLKRPARISPLVIDDISSSSSHTTTTKTTTIIITEDRDSNLLHLLQKKEKKMNNNNGKAEAPPSAISTTGSDLHLARRRRRILHRYSSRRAKLAVRSFRLRLTTIYEGSVI